jgi:hypothetical protein
MEDLHQLRQSDFGVGRSMLGSYYMGSPYLALTSLFPNEKWVPWKMVGGVPNSFWSKIANRKKYLKWLEGCLGWTKPSDWYQISREIFNQNNGRGILSHCYNTSPPAAAMELYPNFDWKGWLFEPAPANYWRSKGNRLLFFRWLEKRLRIRTPEVWYGVSVDMIRSNHGGGVFGPYYKTSVEAVARELYPQYEWISDQFLEVRKAERQLYQVVKELYPGRQVRFNYKHPELRFAKSGAKMELDIFIPSLNLAFEYQGGQHYRAIDRFGGAPAYRRSKRRDQEKKMACKKGNIRLIEVLYTWGGDKESIQNLIHSSGYAKSQPRSKARSMI